MKDCIYITAIVYLMIISFVMHSVLNTVNQHTELLAQKIKTLEYVQDILTQKDR